MKLISRRNINKGALAAAAVGLAAPPYIAKAGEVPVKIGLSISLTGGLAAGGRAGLAALKMWRDDVNKSGGLLGRPVDLIYYDDKTEVSLVPGLYARLMDIDQVDLLFSPYGTNLVAAIAPMLKERNRFVIAQFSIGQNDKLMNDKFFQNGPWGPNSGTEWCRGYFEMAHKKGFKSVAILNSNADFAANCAKLGANFSREYGIKIVSNQSYTPGNLDFSNQLNAINAAAPDFVWVASYPAESSAIIRGVSEIGMSNNVQMFGGAMVGIQYSDELKTLGSSLNGLTNYDTLVIAQTMNYPGLHSFLERYQAIAAKENLDALGHFVPPFFYAGGQFIEQASKATKSIDGAVLADWLHKNTVHTIVGDIAFNQAGSWTECRVLWNQFRNVVNNNLDQFRSPGREIIVRPYELATGDLITPYNRARA